MSAVMVAVQASRHARLRAETDAKVEEDDDAAKIVHLFAEAERMQKAA